MLLFVWSSLVLLFPSFPVLVPILWSPYRARLLQLVSPSLSCCIVFFSSLARSRYLSLFSFSFSFTLWSAGTAKFTISQVLFCLLTITRYGRLAEIKWSFCILKSQIILWVLFPRMDSGLCIKHLFVWSNLNCLHNSQWITLLAKSCLVSYFLSANLLLSLIMGLIVSSLSPHNLHWLFCCVLGILALT